MRPIKSIAESDSDAPSRKTLPMDPAAKADMVHLSCFEDSAADHSFSACLSTFDQGRKRIGLGLRIGIQNPDPFPAGNWEKMMEPSVDAAGISQVLACASDPDIRCPRPEPQMADVNETAGFQFVRGKVVLRKFTWPVCADQ